jgi:mRNA interferase MazF
MRSTTTYSVGDVVLVGFPFTNLQSTKKRPAAVISHSYYQQQRPDVIVLAVTSQVREPLAMGEALVHDWQAAGLLKPSVFKPLIATLEQQRIISIMGRLTDRDQQTLHRVLQMILGK